MQRDLIYDVGMHDGTDTHYYLRKGFRVVAIEADPDLAEAGRARFAREITEGRLVIVNKAIVATRGPVILNRSQNTLWNTVSSERASEFAQRRGVTSTQVEVDGVTSADLLAEHGVPYYMKIDIEGLDLVALEGLRAFDERPAFVSIESERRDIKSVRNEIDKLVSLAYDRFNVVPQHLVHFQKEPVPVKEGQAAGPPERESSGMFGLDLPGPWHDAQGAVDAYRRPLLNHYLTGSDPLIRNRWLRALLKRSGFRAGWYDTHACRADML